MNTRSQLTQTIKLFGQIFDSLSATVPSDDRLIYAQSLAMKVFEHAAAIFDLSFGVNTEPILGEDGLLRAYSSMEVLERSILECLCTFFYIFIDPPDDDTFEFRFCVWQMRGLVVRERFNTDFPPTHLGDVKTQIEYLKDQFEDIDDLRERIKATKQFSSIRKEKSKRKLLKEGKGYFPTWVELSQQVGISPRFSQLFYALLSDQSHSGGLSAIQMIVLSIKERDERIEGAVFFANLLLSRMLFLYVELFPDTQSILDQYPSITQAAKINTLVLAGTK